MMKKYFVFLVLSVSSAEVRMRVFELLTALCICSRDGYEIVLRALQDFQVNITCFFLLEGRDKKNIFQTNQWHTEVE